MAGGVCVDGVVMTGGLSTVVGDVSDITLDSDHVTVRHYEDAGGKRVSKERGLGG